ncbi:MAG: NAD-dependent epimerase/dehydratase family protein [Hymenobacteraceae bacterium]|nr:NAD-dependent epimerase/dehydratase family protein [Hymenobacteraceae bacterium]
MKTALIVGASGLIGQHCLTLLLAADDRYERVISIGRRTLQLAHPRLEQRVVDFDKLEKEQLRLIADDVFCCLGTTIRQAGSEAAFYKVDYSYVVTLAAVLSANFASQFLVMSALGADADSRVFYNRVKGEMEAAVKQTKFRAIHFFQPSLLLGSRPAPRLGERIAAVVLRVVGPLLVGPLRPYRAIRASVVAQAMLDAARQDGGGVRTYRSNEIAAGEAYEAPVRLPPTTRGA